MTKVKDFYKSHTPNQMLKPQTFGLETFGFVQPRLVCSKVSDYNIPL